MAGGNNESGAGSGMTHPLAAPADTREGEVPGSMRVRETSRFPPPQMTY